MAGTPVTGAERRLLLIEFITNERWVFNARFFPFIKGGAAARGFATRWICFGVEFTVEKLDDGAVRQVMPLEGEELALFERELREFAPTHIGLSDPVSEPVARVLREAAPDAFLLCMSDHKAPNDAQNIFEFVRRKSRGARGARGAGRSRFLGNDKARGGSDLKLAAAHARTDWVLDWLGPDEGEATTAEPARGQFIVEAFEPIYDAFMANERSRRYTPHIVLCGGIACDHARAIRKNPHFEGVDLSRVEHDTGCAYCTWYRGATSDLAMDAVETAERQLRSVLETGGNGAGSDGRWCGTFDVYDVRLFRRLDRFFSMVLDLGVPPSTFHFEPRVDRFLQVADRLESVLPRLREAGHKIALFRMGLETLVEEENFLYNKAISVEQVDRAALRLQEFALDYPDSFVYDPTWGFITCSPWTTLENLETLVDRAIERGFEPLGVWLYTPLLLFDGAPITALARSQGGIIRREPEDLALLYEPAVNQVPFEGLIHWGFIDERMGTAFGLIVRFCCAALRWKYPDTLFQDDRLYQQLLAHPALDDTFVRPDLFAREVIQVLLEAEKPHERSTLLERVVARYAAIIDDAPPPRDSRGTAQERRAAERAYRLRFLLEAVCERISGPERSVVLDSVTENRGHGVINLSLTLNGGSYALRLTNPRTTPRFLFRTDEFAVAHGPETPLRSEGDRRVLQAMLRRFGAAVVRHAPELLIPDELPETVDSGEDYFRRPRS